MTLNYGQLNLAARETLARVGARFTLDNYEMALNAVTAQAAKRPAAPTKPTAPTTLAGAVTLLNAATAKLATLVAPTAAAVAEQSTPTNPQPGDVYLDEEARTIRVRSKGWSGREPERVREYALPDSNATNIPAPLRDKQSK